VVEATKKKKGTISIFRGEGEKKSTSAGRQEGKKEIPERTFFRKKKEEGERATPSSGRKDEGRRRKPHSPREKKRFSERGKPLERRKNISPLHRERETARGLQAKEGGSKPTLSFWRGGAIRSQTKRFKRKRGRKSPLPVSSGGRENRALLETIGAQGGGNKRGGKERSIAFLQNTGRVPRAPEKNDTREEKRKARLFLRRKERKKKGGERALF